MKHLLLLLYLMSYTSGIGAITLGAFYYLKSKDISVKYAVTADIFFTIFLSFDTLNFYTDVIIGSFPTWLQIVKILGLMASSIGIVYYLTISIYIVIGLEVSSQKKRLFSIAITAFLTMAVIVIIILCLFHVISVGTALQSGFFIPNIVTSIIIAYDIFLIIRKWDKISIKIKRFVSITLILAIIIVPISILSNLIQYWKPFSIPIAYSPVEYFILNLLIIAFAKKSIQAKPETVKVIQKYNLTQREIEISELIAAGLTNQQIAEKLFISSNTARNHIYNIYKKLGIKNRYELMKIISNKSEQ